MGSSGCLDDGCLLLSDLRRGAVSVALDDPFVVVGALELEDRLAEVLDGLEPPDPEQVLLERSAKALGAAVAFRCTDEGGRARRAEEAELVWKSPLMYWEPWS